jgi:hypothetical protein
LRGVHVLDDLWQSLPQVEGIEVVDRQPLVPQPHLLAALLDGRNVHIKVRLHGCLVLRTQAFDVTSLWAAVSGTATGWCLKLRWLLEYSICNTSIGTKTGVRSGSKAVHVAARAHSNYLQRSNLEESDQQCPVLLHSA